MIFGVHPVANTTSNLLFTIAKDRNMKVLNEVCKRMRTALGGSGGIGLHEIGLSSLVLEERIKLFQSCETNLE